MMVLSYFVRAYRLYFVFNLGTYKDDENSVFYLNRHRATQRWTVFALIVIISPFIIISATVLVVFVSFPESNPGLYINGENGKMTTIHSMISILCEFFLELSLILIMYFIRIVENDFQMLKELLSVTIVLCLSPIFYLFVNEEKSFLYVFIARNLILMIISSVAPILLSYIRADTIELLSLDMLNCFELILQHPTTLNSFEEFLKTYDKGNGAIFLELFLSCECFFDLNDQKLGENILNKVKEYDLDIPFFYPDEIDCSDGESLKPVLKHCLSILEDDYYPVFKNSKQFFLLKGLICRQQIFNNRIAETSLRRTGQGTGLNSTMVKLISLYNYKD